MRLQESEDALEKSVGEERRNEGAHVDCRHVGHRWILMEEEEYGFCEPPNYGEKGGNGDAGDHGCLEVDTHFMVYFCSVGLAAECF